MKSSSVRRPALGNTSAEGRNRIDMSVGDIMRQAKKDLLLKRCALILLAVLILTAIVYLVVIGAAADLVDGFFSLMD